MFSRLFFVFFSDALNRQHDTMLGALHDPVDNYGVRIVILFVLARFLAAKLDWFGYAAARTLLTFNMRTVQELSRRLLALLVVRGLNLNRKVAWTQAKLL